MIFQSLERYYRNLELVLKDGVVIGLESTDQLIPGAEFWTLHRSDGFVVIYPANSILEVRGYRNDRDLVIKNTI